MSEPVSPQKAPYATEIKAGETYYWCACVEVKINLFVIAHIKEQISSPLYLLQKKTKQCIYAL